MIYLRLQFQSPQHSYKVKIINPHHKSDMIVYLHNFTSRFESAVVLRMKLVQEFKDVVPDSLSFSVGYFEGQNHSQIWLVTREDFSTMYGKVPKRGDYLVVQWSRVSERSAREMKFHQRDRKEDEVDDIYKELKEKHGEKYDTPRLRL